MTVPEIARLLLRLAHAIAAAVWLGGGAYYVLALRPQLRQADASARAVGQSAQKEFGEWASVATLVLVATGVVLMFDRLSDGRGTIVYVVLLGIKITAAIAAFWLTGRYTRRRKVRGGASSRINRAWAVLTLGAVAFAIGVVLSTIYPTGVGQ